MTMSLRPVRTGGNLFRFVLLLVPLLFVTSFNAHVIIGQPNFGDEIAVANRKILTTDSIACERISLGQADDYKPCVARLPTGELLLTAFHQYKRDGGKGMEQTLLFRSLDEGRTWADPRPLEQFFSRRRWENAFGNRTLEVAVRTSMIKC